MSTVAIGQWGRLIRAPPHHDSYTKGLRLSVLRGLAGILILIPHTHSTSSMVFHRYLPQEARNTANASIAVLTVFVLDWICNLDDEVEVMMRTGLNTPIFVYHVSRGTTLALCIWAALTSVGSVGGSILTTSRVVWCLRWASAASISLLFFFRVRAVYCHSRPVIALFALLWALILLTPIAGLFGLIHTCDGSVCPDGTPLALAMDISIFVHDTLVFLCISHKIYGNAFSSTPLPKSRTANIKRFFSGQGLYVVSKSLLLSGQLYYAVTIGVLVVAAAAVYTGLPYSDVLEIVYVALSSALACRVFRMLLMCTRETEDAAFSLRIVEVTPIARLSITADKPRSTGDFPP